MDFIKWNQVFQRFHTIPSFMFEQIGLNWTEQMFSALNLFPAKIVLYGINWEATLPPRAHLDARWKIICTIWLWTCHVGIEECQDFDLSLPLSLNKSIRCLKFYRFRPHLLYPPHIESIWLIDNKIYVQNEIRITSDLWRIFSETITYLKLIKLLLPPTRYPVGAKKLFKHQISF